MRFLLLLFVTLLLTCCTNSSKTMDADHVKTLNVDLQKKADPFEELFSKAEIIPLETTDSCLLVYMEKVFPIGDSYYIYDFWLQRLLQFGRDGKFKQRIGKPGNGPGEYLSMYDCCIDSVGNEINYIGIFGKIWQYDLAGNFIKSYDLPTRPHYYSAEIVDDNHICTWTCLAKDEDCILVIDEHTGDSINGGWNDDRVFNHQMEHPFYRYDGKCYYSIGLRPEVYEVTTTGLQHAYTWNFGRDNIKQERLDYYLSIENDTERNNTIIDDIGTSSLPFILKRQKQNNTYCYIALQRNAAMRPQLTHVFYNKQADKSIVFDNLSDDCPLFYPLYFGDEYMLSDVILDYKESYKSVLSEEDYQKLMAMSEDDNPCLIKLYFKK